MWSLNVNLKGDLDQDLWAYPLNSGPSPKALMDCGNNIYEASKKEKQRDEILASFREALGGFPHRVCFFAFLLR